MNGHKLSYLYVIADRKKKDAITAELCRFGAALVDFVYAKGYHESRGILDMLGFRDEPSKVVITGLISRERSAEIIEILNDKYAFTQPETGIAFTVPVDKLSY